MTLTYKSGADNKYLDEKFARYLELELPVPSTNPKALWATGINYGYSSAPEYLGNSDNIHRSSPVMIGSADWKAIGGSGYAKFAIRSDGALYGWGNGTNGKDLGANGSRTPVPVGSSSNWKYVQSGGEGATGIQNDGSLWVWGMNYFGVLGLGSYQGGDISSPIKGGWSTNDWADVAISLSTYNGSGVMGAIKTNGTLWTWGQAGSGALGNGTTYPNLTWPTQVGTSTNWKQISSSYLNFAAIKTDGTLWAWGHGGSTGYDGSYALGLGTTGHRSSPTQVGTATNWKVVRCGYGVPGGGSRYAIKTDGTLWTWGNGIATPTQVGGLTNWKDVSVGMGGIVAAIKTDGTLWTWGNNGIGQLGLGDRINVTSPVQVGSLTTWTQANAGYSASTFIRQYY